MDAREARERLRERLKADYRCTWLLEKDRRGQGWTCPWCGSGSHANGTGALAYYPDTNRVQCFACGTNADSIALYEQVRGTDHNTALEGMAREMGTDTASDLVKSNLTAFRDKGGTDIAHSPKIDSGATEKPTDHTGYFAECQARLATDTEALGYLGARGIGLQTARAYGVGYDPRADMSRDGKSGYPSPRIIIPMGGHGYVGRSTKPLRAKAYEKMIKGRMWVTAPDGLQAEDRGRPIWICEGAFDAMSIAEAGGLSVSTNSIGGGKRAVDWIKSLGLTDRRYIILPDNDPDPETRGKVRKAAEKLGADLGLLGIPTAVAQLNDFDGKDANDLLRADRDRLGAFVKDTERTAIFLIGGRPTGDGRSKALDWGDWIGTDRDAELSDNDANCAKQGGPSDPDPAELSGKEAQKSEADAFWDGQTATLTGFVGRATSGAYRGIRTGLGFWDGLTDGILPQTLTVLVAPPASGKTTLCLQLAEAMATKRPVLYANLEMPQDQMLAKSISRRTYEAVLRGGSTIAMTAKEVLEGHKDGYDTERVSRTLGEYASDTGARLMYLDAVQKGKDCTIEGIADGYERAAEYCKAKGMGAPILMVDYLHLVGVRNAKKSSTMDIIKDVVQRLKDIAIAHDTAVIAISSTGREATAKGRMTMQSARDSSNIEYMADYFLSLDHYGYYAPKNPKESKAGPDLAFDVDTATAVKKRPMILKIHKSRMGEAGKYKRIWLQAEYGYFTAARRESEVYGTEVFSYSLAQLLGEYYKKEGALEEPTDNPFASEGRPLDWDGEVKAEGRGGNGGRKKRTGGNIDIAAVLESN